MTDLNNVVLLGRLVETPKLRTVGDSGFKVLDFTVAVNRSYKKKDSDSWVERVSFIDCSAFGPLAERRSQAKWMVKGNPVVVQGSLSQDRWEKDGQKFSKLKVEAEDVLPVPSQKSADEKQAEQPAPQQEESAPSDAELAADYEQSDIF